MFSRLVVLMGMPRSGTSWLSQIFDSSPETRFRLSPLFSYEFKNRLTELSSAAEWRAVLEGAYRSSSDFMSQGYRRRTGQYPVFSDKEPEPPVLVVKDTRFHDLTGALLGHFPEARVVALVRHPCGSINSWLRAPREFPAGADPRREWRSGACRKTGYGEYWGFEDWRSVTRLYLRLAEEHPERVTVARYEALVADPAGETRRLFAFCGLGYGPRTEEFLRACHRRHDASEYAVFKSPEVAERWRTELDPEIRAAILTELHGTELEVFCR
jgi:hypothetical protein